MVEARRSSGKVPTVAWIGALSAATLVALIVSGPRLSKAERGNEASAIVALRAVNSAQAAFASSCGGRGYVTDLADLVKTPRGSRQDFISPDLRHNGIVKSGYVITVARGAAPGVTQLSSTACVELSGPLVTSYFASAVPLKPGETGTRFFATDASGTIYQSTSGPIPNPISAAAIPVQ
jgi:hypothetical protein